MDLIEPAVRTFLGIFFLMIGLQFSARTLGLYARMGFSHIHYGARGKATWWHRHIFNVFRAAILLVFLAVMTGQLGFFLALPSAFSLVCLVAGVLVITRQAKEEEKALAQRFGQDYEVYRARVPRWF
ncbi:methyltransferase family protein [Marinobacter sp. LQ44]|uniref:methyltransferase family protein n=1 Tax=unclassified Marinobacter TaxID=83889 RepID=UPI00071900A6|nr:hypothetical protein [Marinobacter sp. LQ44]AMQ90364.1 hypothetical protein ASQ50_17605 [Marinobacter sp. LQ44]